jgi:mono/diheme cytochrome c family protein
MNARKETMRIAIGVVLLLAAACAFHSQVHAQQSASVWDGVYTAGQAARGKAAYGKNCASCHGDTLDGSGQTPELYGDEFRGRWDGQTLDDLFEKIQSSMPADRPGQLTREQNADILAFLLTSNGFPSSAKELPTDAATLQKIKFVATKPK